MKSKIFKAALMATAALAMGAMATTTQAKTLNYAFGTPFGSGGEYCDGLALTTSDKVVYSGFHDGSCEGSAQYAGGFSAKISGTTYLDISTTDYFLPGYAISFLLDTKGMTWAVYGNLGGGFEFLNSGPLIKGMPPVGKKAGAKSSVFKNPKAEKPLLSYSK